MHFTKTYKIHYINSFAESLLLRKAKQMFKRAEIAKKLFKIFHRTFTHNIQQKLPA